MIATVVEKAVRRIAPDRRKGKLDAAIAKLGALVEGLAREDQFLVDSIALFQQHLQRVNDAEIAVAAALASKEIDKVASALKQPEITPEFVKHQLNALNAHKNYRTPYAGFLGSNPEAKELLEGVCELRLERAQIDAERVFTEEQARIGSDYDANESPVVRRARATASHLQTALNRIQTEAIENTFVPFASQLLSE
jgi:hypothetical protein